MIKELNKCLSAMIYQYYTGSKNEQLYKQIFEKIQELLYFMPSECFGLAEEDCADFLLMISGRIESIFAKYDYRHMNFVSYLYPQVSKLVFEYNKKKDEKESKEKSVMYNHTAFEYSQSLLDNSIENLYASESKNRYVVGNNLAVKRMQAVFYLQPIARKRFFLYFISYSVLMETSTIKKICSLFNYNYQQTMTLTNYLKSNRTYGREEIDHARNLRNEYFGKQLYFENKLSELNYLADDENENDIYERNNNIERIEKMKYRQEVKSSYIQSQMKRVPRSILVEVLNRSDGTIANYMTRSSKLLEWCLNPSSMQIKNSFILDIGINDNTAKKVLHKSEVFKLARNKFPEFKPIDYFHINIPLNS